MTEYKITPSSDETYIILKVVGEIIGQEMMKHIVKAHALGSEMNINCYLVDTTEARNVDSNLNNFNFAHSEIKHTEEINKQAKIVALVNKEDHSHDFIEKVFIKAGYNFKLFTDPNLAMAHLRQKTRNEEPFQPTASPTKKRPSINKK